MYNSRAELIRGSLEKAIASYTTFNVVDNYEPATKPQADMPFVWVGVPLRPEQYTLDEGGDGATITSETNVFIVGVFQFTSNSARDAFNAGSRMADSIDYALRAYLTSTSESELTLEQYGYRFVIENWTVTNTNETPDITADNIGEVVLNVKVDTVQYDL